MLWTTVHPKEGGKLGMGEKIMRGKFCNLRQEKCFIFEAIKKVFS
jgi:hypothetical protein